MFLAKPGLLVFVMAGTAAVLCASEPWKKDSGQWTSDDAQRILTASPWAQAAVAAFANNEEREPPPPGPLPGAAQAGMAGPRAATDGRWDGGVGRMQGGGVPTLPLTVRWDSALPVREALTRLNDSSSIEVQARNDYVIAVLGLVPAGRYRTAGHLPKESRSGEGDSATDPRDPEQMLEGLMAESRLRLRGRKPIMPKDAKLDAASGTLYLFFPRTEAISTKDKEIVFTTRFGSMTVRKQFRVKDMTYKGKLEL
jgi:hypothetical protein